MADRRILIASRQVELVKRLVQSEERTGPFKLQADVLAFAAAFGASRDARSPLGETTRDPIRREVFDRQGYDTLINVLAVHRTKDLLVLADSDAAEDQRATIFEEYACGGLDLIENELKGAVDEQERILLLVAQERKGDREKG